MSAPNLGGKLVRAVVPPETMLLDHEQRIKLLERGPITATEVIVESTSTDLLYGSGPPIAGVGINGNFYIDVLNNHLYGPKGAVSWPTAFTDLHPVEFYQQNDEPIGAHEGAIWVDTDETVPLGPAGPVGPMGPQGPVGLTGAKGNTGSIGLQGPPGIAGLKLVYGKVGETGTIEFSGSGGWSVTRPGIGTYLIAFDPDLASVQPIVLAMPFQSTAYTATCSQYGADVVAIRTWNPAGSAQNCAFDFTVITPT